MIFKQKEDGSCNIEFSWKERWSLFIKGKIIFDSAGLKHFSNMLVKMVSDWHQRFDDKTKQIQTHDSSEPPKKQAFNQKNYNI